jgi:hypothetical protein
MTKSKRAVCIGCDPKTRPDLASMAVLAESAVTSYNALLAEQRNVALEAKFSLSTLNSTEHRIYTSVPLSQTAPLLDEL